MKNKISIITAVYNGAATLELLIQSVLAQETVDYEFIIIDGNSKDGSKEIIKKYSDNLAYWVSEPDKGIYDAWNKGVMASTGDWIMFLGADDILLPGALNTYISYIAMQEKFRKFDYVSSRMEMIDLNGRIIRIKGWEWEWPGFLKEMTVAHPGSLHASSLFKKYGLYDQSYRIVGDYEFLLRPRNELKAGFVNKVTVRMSEGGASDSVAAIKEHYKAVTQTGGMPRSQALGYALIVYVKFRTKKLLRGLGINAYLKKA